MRKMCAILPKDYIGHLDHICPLTSLLEIDFFTDCAEIAAIAKQQYPKITLYLEERNLYRMSLSSYDSILTTLPRQIIDLLFFSASIEIGKEPHTIWMPHGQSDKDNMHALTKEICLFIYGDKMKSMIKPVLQSNTIQIGNFRKAYFDIHREFYETLVKNVLDLTTDTKYVLFAPSFEKGNIHTWVEALIQKKPADITLLIKLHPNTVNLHQGQSLKNKYEEHPGCKFIEDFFPIYPILSFTHALFSDISSICYDFLFFQKQMFFTSSENTPMQKCGETCNSLDPYKNLDKNISLYSKQQKELYLQSFAKYTLPQLK